MTLMREQSDQKSVIVTKLRNQRTLQDPMQCLLLSFNTQAKSTC
jgi:hypothetical protein